MVQVHLATRLHHRQPTQVPRNQWFNSNVTWLLKPKLAGVRPYLQVELDRSSKSIHLVVIEELGISRLLVQRAHYMTNAVSKNRGVFTKIAYADEYVLQIWSVEILLPKNDAK